MNLSTTDHDAKSILSVLGITMLIPDYSNSMLIRINTQREVIVLEQLTSQIEQAQAHNNTTDRSRLRFKTGMPLIQGT